LGKNRDRLSIVAAILDAVHFGASKTRIMSKANLSFKLLEKYLGIAIRTGYVRIEEGKYKLTEEGLKFLKEHRQLENRFWEAQKILGSIVNERERLAQSCEESFLLKNEVHQN
jgi:predicted transcriptional regulator